ncbi:hypothetical protein Q1695_005594 [Nippostrongylus brasiliensis]|nr:hypothetical protein Q1695_005594 [Nippostrongylus brasiliensis]
MSRILAGLDDNCLAYLDDIIIFDKDFDSHLRTLRKVLERFRVFNIKVAGKKLTSIAQSQICFLGHEISGSTYFPATRNITAIENLPPPTSAKAVKSFLGMVNFFRKFVKGFASIAAPLYDLCKSQAVFRWEPAHQAAFDQLKQALVSRPCLAFPQDREFILHTDGSTSAVGAALLQQQDQTTTPAPIGFFSKTLSASQRRWSPTHIELFAMISALRFFRPIIYGNHTRIFSDHKPLTFLLRHHKTHDNLARWMVELQSYDISIEYLKGSSNVVADHLSRYGNPTDRFLDDSPSSNDLVEFPRCLAQRHPSSTSSVAPHFVRPYDVLIEQKSDTTCSALMSFLETGAFPDSVSEVDKDRYLALASNCILGKNGCLYYQPPEHTKRPTLFIPLRLRESICIALHSSPSAGGHIGWKKTLAKISRRFFWPTMKVDVFNFVRSCEPCQRKRPHPLNREKLTPIVSEAVFAKVFLDLSGPYRPSARHNKYILCLIDHFTKYAVAVALPDCTAVSVAHAIVSNFILVYGAMSELISDNASYLKGDLLTELGRLLQIGRHFTTPYHHQGNGVCERIFQTFQEMLRTYIDSDQLNWDVFLPACVFAYNTSVHLSTNESPFFMLFGRDPVLNIDLLIRHRTQQHIPSDTDPSIYKESLVSSLHAVWSSVASYNTKRREAMKSQSRTSSL